MRSAAVDELIAEEATSPDEVWAAAERRLDRSISEGLDTAHETCDAGAETGRAGRRGGRRPVPGHPGEDPEAADLRPGRLHPHRPQGAGLARGRPELVGEIELHPADCPVQHTAAADPA